MRTPGKPKSAPEIIRTPEERGSQNDLVHDLWFGVCLRLACSLEQPVDKTVGKEWIVKQKVWPKATKAEIELRVNEVYTWLLGGKTHGEMVREGAKLWAISSRQIDDYIAMAYKRLHEVNSATFEENRAKVLAGHWSLFRTASEIVEHEVRNKDGEVIATIKKQRSPSEARKNLAEIAKITGLEEINITVKTHPSLRAPNGEMLTGRALVEKLKAELAAYESSLPAELSEGEAVEVEFSELEK